jgi:hypothetical protein
VNSVGQKRLEFMIFYQAFQMAEAGKRSVVVRAVCGGGIRVCSHINGISGIRKVSICILNTGLIHRSSIVRGTVIAIRVTANECGY